MKVLEKLIDWNTDKVIGVGLVLTLILSLWIGTSENIQTNIISGLIGYMSKTVVDRRGEER